ncbi:hypothetical protein VTO73DRAFT_7406 [Trametes versicolor]
MRMAAVYRPALVSGQLYLLLCLLTRRPALNSRRARPIALRPALSHVFTFPRLPLSPSLCTSCTCNPTPWWRHTPHVYPRPRAAASHPVVFLDLLPPHFPSSLPALTPPSSPLPGLVWSSAVSCIRTAPIPMSALPLPSISPVFPASCPASRFPGSASLGRSTSSSRFGVRVRVCPPHEYRIVRCARASNRWTPQATWLAHCAWDFPASCLPAGPFTPTISAFASLAIASIQHFRRGYQTPFYDTLMSSPTFQASPTEGAPQPPAPTPQSRKASKPFDREDADFILRSGDRVVFHVHRIILTLASPVFADMLSLPQPPGAADTERPVVDVSEDSEALDVLLRVCYPEPVPDFPSLDLLHRVLGAAMKYEIHAAIVLAKNAMVQPQFMEESPLHVFVIACRLGLEDQAAAAARHAVEKDLVEGVTCPGLDDISAGAYYRLLDLHRSVVVVKHGSGKRCKHCPRRSTSRQVITSVGPFCEPSKRAASVQRAPLQAVNSPFDAPDADLILRSNDSLEFRISQTNIAILSASDLIARAPRSELHHDGENDDQLSVHLMAEDSVVVDTMLRMCVLTSSVPLDDLDLLLDDLSASRKYGLSRVEAIIRHSWPVYITRDPLRLYFAAVRYGWVTEAHLCARSLFRFHDIPSIHERYLLEFETMANGPYRRLLSYLEACSQAATAKFQLELEVPQRPCCGAPEQCPCQARYPNSIRTPNPHTEDVSIWSLTKFPISHIRSLTDALRKKPCGSTLGSDSQAARTFLGDIANDASPCQTHNVVSLAVTCPPATNLKWAWAVLDAYASAVDNAVSKVSLP